MSKGLIINEDVWDLMEDLDSKETRSLIVSLSALVRGEDVPQMTRVVKAVYNRILLDNGRARSDISEIRRQAALKRWRKDKDIQNDAKVYANNAKDAKDANAFCITEEEKERSKEKEDIYTPTNNTFIFHPPSVEDIKQYADSKGYIGFNAERFYLYYDSVKWMVGKHKMQNWKSAVSSWYLRDKEREKNKHNDLEEWARL